MPRENHGRAMRREEDVRRRIQHEREARGWSYDRTAAEMKRVGCPIQATAVHKMEKGSPPRRITVEELHGFAVAFDMEPAELLVPVETMQDEELRRRLVELAGVRRRLRELAGLADQLDVDIANHMDDTGTGRERLAAVREAAGVDGDLFGDPERDEELFGFLDTTSIHTSGTRLLRDGTIERWGAARREVTR